MANATGPALRIVASSKFKCSRLWNVPAGASRRLAARIASIGAKADGDMQRARAYVVARTDALGQSCTVAGRIIRDAVVQTAPIR